MRRKNRSGFTLIELLVVVSIIALLISILLPAIARARELARRAACAANLSGIGKAFYAYAVENDGSLPATAPNSTMNSPAVAVEYYNMTGKYGGVGMDPNNSAVNPPGNYWRQLSTSRNMWAVAKIAGASPKSFICPSSGDSPDLIDNPGDYFDFAANPNALPTSPDRGWTAGANNEGCISYGMQVVYGARGRPTIDGDPRMAAAADKGPYGGISLGNPQLTAPPPTLDPLRASPDEWMPYNSNSHGGVGTGEGQNVLFVDSHVEFLGKPIVGPGMDNIYTAWDMKGTQPDYASRYWGKRPSTSAMSLVPAEHTDVLIYP